MGHGTDIILELVGRRHALGPLAGGAGKTEAVAVLTQRGRAA